MIMRIPRDCTLSNDPALHPCKRILCIALYQVHIIPCILQIRYYVALVIYVVAKVMFFGTFEPNNLVVYM